LTPPAGLELRSYQKDAIRAWSKADGRGVFAMAAGGLGLHRRSARGASYRLRMQSIAREAGAGGRLVPSRT